MGCLLYAVLVVTWLLLSGLFVVCVFDCCFKDGLFMFGMWVVLLEFGCVLGRCIDLLVALAVLELCWCAWVIWCTILAIYLSSAVGFGVSSL